MSYRRNKANFIKIGAYITGYRDSYLIQKTIEYLVSQSHAVDFIFIVDNSPASLNISISIPHIIKHCPNNIGVAGGLSTSMQWFLDNEYDFIWAFDQDSQIAPNSLQIMLSEYNYLDKNHIPVAIISPTVIDSQSQIRLANGYLNKYQLNWRLPNKVDYYQESLYQCDVVITSGSLINLQAAKNIPLPNPDLFIDGVDWEYCLNLRKQGYHICVSEKTTMQHNFGTYLTHLNKDHPIYIYSPLRYYYINRNHTYIETRLSDHPYYRTLSYLHRIKSLIKKIGKIIIYEPDQKLLKIWASCLGFYHGLIGKLGKTWLP
ncbi:hypothetical protein [Synechocystis sp. LKSZ1]|uniref:hypothetical protein n=1 Tax=Synechocystis sp. LKSZ1 TaxID=3144951 RepID=UPI00336BB057